MNTKILLDECQIPKQWYNIIPDMPGPLHPVINPRTLQPVTPDDLLPIFPMSIIEQEMERLGLTLRRVNATRRKVIPDAFNSGREAGERVFSALLRISILSITLCPVTARSAPG